MVLALNNLQWLIDCETKIPKAKRNYQLIHSKYRQSSRLGMENIPSAFLQRGKTSPNECHGYDTKQSDGEAPVMQNTSSLPPIPGPHCPRMVAPNKVQSVDQVELFDIQTESKQMTC